MSQTGLISHRKAHSARRAVIPAATALIAVALAAGSVLAQSASPSGNTATGPPVARPKYKPIDLEIEAPSLDFMRVIPKVLNEFHDEYRGFKKE